MTPTRGPAVAAGANAAAAVVIVFIGPFTATDVVVMRSDTADAVGMERTVDAGVAVRLFTGTDIPPPSPPPSPLLVLRDDSAAGDAEAACADATVDLFSTARAAGAAVVEAGAGDTAVAGTDTGVDRAVEGESLRGVVLVRV